VRRPGVIRRNGRPALATAAQRRHPMPDLRARAGSRLERASPPAPPCYSRRPRIAPSLLPVIPPRPCARKRSWINPTRALVEIFPASRAQRYSPHP